MSVATTIAQFVRGSVQPVFGAVADRCGPGRFIVFSALMLVGGCVLTTQVTNGWGWIVAVGVLCADGADAGIFRSGGRTAAASESLRS